jgi:anion-transporting  ArsA/GET3 family ATPase
MNTVDDLLRERRVVVSTGAGGVGKTTTAAALALESALAGRRTLALTVDPSKRLAQALGVTTQTREPVRPPALAEVFGRDVPLDVWLLDPRGVAERVIGDVVEDPKTRDALFANRLYQELSTMMAGMVEYTALEALHDFVTRGRYDLVVLDTPPSRHALDILEGPRRLAAFLDGKVFQLFLPPEGTTSALRAGAARVLRSVLGRAFGEAEYDELTQFFGAFAGVLRACSTHTSRLEALLADASTTAFVLVTTPTPAARDELAFVAETLAQHHMHFAGIVLTRCDTETREPAPSDEELAQLPANVRAALEDAQRHEATERSRQGEAFASLRRAAPEDTFLTAVPTFPGGIDSLADLARVGRILRGGAPRNEA